MILEKKFTDLTVYVEKDVSGYILHVFHHGKFLYSTLPYQSINFGKPCYLVAYGNLYDHYLCLNNPREMITDCFVKMNGRDCYVLSFKCNGWLGR